MPYKRSHIAEYSFDIYTCSNYILNILHSLNTLTQITFKYLVLEIFVFHVF